MISKLSQLWRRLVHYLRREEFDRELNEEMRFHLEMKAQENLESGMTAADARYAAERQFGNQALLKEASRDMWRFRWLDMLIQDLRYGWRMMAKNPTFTAVAVLTLALGIGANTAIFSLIDAVLLKMLPVKNPEQLVAINTINRGRIDRKFSYSAYKQFRDQTEVFSGVLAATNTDKVNIIMNDQGPADPGLPELVAVKLVSGNYFSVLGVNPILGRAIREEEAKFPGSSPVAVISHGYWQRRFALDRSVLGKAFTHKGTIFTIIGVAAREFFGESLGEAPDIWLPLTMQPQAPAWVWDGHSVTWLQIMARLKPEVTRDQAFANVDVVFNQIQSEIVGPMKNEVSRQQALDKRIFLEEAGNGFSELREKFSQPLQILMLLVGLVLLIACANLASMMLARASMRRTEMAVRISLGAGPLRIFRQSLTESLLLAVIGGAFGLLIAWWGSGILLTLVSRGPDPIPLNVRPDLRLLAFTGAISLLTGILFGLAPALRATQVNLIPALKSSPLSLDGGSYRFTPGRLLVAGQVALSLVLLIGAGLFVRSLMKLKSLDAGFNRENVLLLRIDPAATRYKNAQLLNLYDRLLERVESIPGVRAASLSFFGLFSGGAWGNKISVQGYTPKPNEFVSTYANNAVGPKYFETMGMSLLAGRSFTPQDNETAPKVAVINESMARRFFGNDNPIGKRFGLGGVENSGKIEIVGVIKDLKFTSLREEVNPAFYLPYHQYITNMHQLEVRTNGDPVAVAAAVRREIQAVEKNLPVLEVTTLAQKVDASLIQERLLAKLSGAFGLLALLLTCIGLYGLMSYSVVRRTNEIGIRMALGAQTGDVLRLVLRETMVMVVAGIIVGLGAAIATTRLIAAYLFGLTPTDPITISLAALLVISVAALAGYLPARRASRVDPMVALRHE